MDDEYCWAGVEDPKIMITTSHDPSSRLKMFVKELRLVFPNAQRLNRGNYEMKQLLDACRANGVTDFVIVHEHRGQPDALIVSHLPYGPTAYFNISDVVMRHDIPDIGPMSEQYPHLVFHNMKTQLGQRVTSILKYLFPVPKEDSKRVITFANHDDFISFRHHTYKKGEGGKGVELKEVGPRFQLRRKILINSALNLLFNKIILRFMSSVRLEAGHHRPGGCSRHGMGLPALHEHDQETTIPLRRRRMEGLI